MPAVLEEVEPRRIATRRENGRRQDSAGEIENVPFAGAPRQDSVDEIENVTVDEDV